MNYAEAVQYLYSQTPDFQQLGKAAYKPGLDNMLRLDKYLGHPHRAFTSVHVAGTNGKGSTSHMLASVLQRAGYAVGLYTSPHLNDFRERIRVNGIPIAQQEVARFVAAHKAAVGQVQPSFFELTTAMAFCYFAQQKVDAAVVEVGLGGRLDSTNIITPALSIITNIGLDHTDLLGHTLEEIAAEKAGIIKSGVPLVVGEYQPEVAQVFERKASECGVPITFASLQEQPDISHYKLDLHGDYQQHNLRTVLAAIGILRQQKVFNISPRDIEDGLRTAAATTGLRGRWQQLCSAPKIVCDTGHNAHGLAQTMAQLSREKYEQLHVVFGMVADKDVDSAVSLLPKTASYYFTQASLPRALNADALAAKCRAIGLHGEAYPTVALALHAALHAASPRDFIYVGGSTFVVGEALRDLKI
ncbi:MAG: bifunctional folylpolyglutamate synthase/dihydrofolate synthase [Prevotellaceae bacterium]|jgi:dihydrofolate synthase/folylpolyglutamate synthase|nr:bifunctional folylpolyglutamate synthase/dihydrofolate synthase [Prevotellaceae bacterium]